MGATQHASDPSYRRVPLARGNDGEPFLVPADAVAWRVRRFRNPGRPGACELCYGDDGGPLEIAIDVPVPEFREAVANRPGRYRLDAIDGDGVAVPKLPPAYLQLDAATEPRAANTSATVAPIDPTLETLREMVQGYREMARENTALARAVIDRFPAMMDSAAGLLRAADGAGLPHRSPVDTRNAIPAADDGDDDGGDEIPPTGWPIAITQMVGQLLPMVQAFIAHRMGVAPRNGADACASVDPPEPEVPPRAPASDTAPRRPTTPPAEAKPRKSAEPVATMPTPDQLAHFAAVQSALTPREAQIAATLAVQLKPAERAVWLAELARRSVTDAVALLRRHLAETAPDTRGPTSELGVRKPDNESKRTDNNTNPEESP